MVHVQADLSRLVQRLRGLSSAAWRSRRTVVDELLAGLEEITAKVEGRSPRPIPALADYARADAVAVLGGDAIAATGERGDAADFSGLTAWIQRTLGQTQ